MLRFTWDPGARVCGCTPKAFWSVAGPGDEGASAIRTRHLAAKRKKTVFARERLGEVGGTYSWDC